MLGKGVQMEVSAKELRGKPTQIIEQAARGTDVVITIRGKKKAKLVAYKNEQKTKDDPDRDDEIFGLWKDHKKLESVESYVRSKRKGRSF
jgi:prevent-host-death family protein